MKVQFVRPFAAPAPRRNLFGTYRAPARQPKPQQRPRGHWGWPMLSALFLNGIELVAAEPMNQPPVANSQSLTTEEGAALRVTLSGSDADGDVLNYLVAESPSNGSLEGVGQGTGAELTYTPNPGFTGTDTFTFVADDGLEPSTPATVTINVGPAGPALKSFSFPNFLAPTGLGRFRAATARDGVLQLTGSAPSQNGTAIFGSRVALGGGFGTELRFRIRNPAGALDAVGVPGGDGLALIIQRQGPAATGPVVGYIPYSIADAIALEFDTYANSNLNDPNGNHLSLQAWVRRLMRTRSLATIVPSGRRHRPSTSPTGRFTPPG